MRFATSGRCWRRGQKTIGPVSQPGRVSMPIREDLEDGTAQVMDAFEGRRVVSGEFAAEAYAPGSALRKSTVHLRVVVGQARAFGPADRQGFFQHPAGEFERLGHLDAVAAPSRDGRSGFPARLAK